MDCPPPLAAGAPSPRGRAVLRFWAGQLRRCRPQSVPEGVHLIPSVPGRHAGPAAQGPAREEGGGRSRGPPLAPWVRYNENAYVVVVQGGGGWGLC